MKKLPALAQGIDWYEQRPLRERIMLFVCALVVVFFLWNLMVLQPFDKHRKQLRNKGSQIQLQLSELDAREQVVEARRNFDPDRENRQRMKILQAEVDKFRVQLAENVVNLISPQEMPELLKELLKRQKKLHLISLENLPAEELKINEKAAEKALAPSLYRHRLRMEFAGDYLTTLNYLRELEKLPRNMVWDGLEIETLDYPRAKVRLEVFTLSLTEGWIGG